MQQKSIVWPNNAKFAFSIFDDTDSQTLQRGKPVYDLLIQLGLRTTKSVWVNHNPCHTDVGMTCNEPEYLQWVHNLQNKGFEIGWHMAGSCTSNRSQTLQGLEKFAKLFGHYPYSMANHYECKENIYFGDSRVSGLNRIFYNLVTKNRNRKAFYGEVQGHPLFWGDACREKIKFVRNFVFPGINTMEYCPQMPYHDPDRPYVNYWFASSEGANVESFNRLLCLENQEKLVRAEGACIVYTHFGLGFSDPKTYELNSNFKKLMGALAKKNGWFVPVSELLHYILQERGEHRLSARERRMLEWRWLRNKLKHGSS